ncbi:MAG: rod shape-determining protein MreC [Pontiellaceae bacterium]|nr:rod shape-determining protein MreC [Pontiellaceae bacterium]MBN2785648.1 rod shape-determining protein MreC [Pontiellaceae bacterium]
MAAVVLLVVVFVPLPSLTLRGKGVVRGSVAPAERATSGIWRRLSEAGAAIRGIGGTAEKNMELSRELIRLQTELNRLRDAEADNVRLHRALNFYRKKPDTMIPCDIVSRNISGWWSTVRIGKGSRAGIDSDLAVISPDGLVGKTTEPTPFTTEVLLISDPACQVSAKIKLKDKEVYGLVRGTGSNLKGEPRARIEFINKDILVSVNDEVVTSGLGAFPKGVHIGYVDEVYRDKSGLFQYAEIIPRATVGLLDYVFVVVPSAREVPE